MNKKMFDFVYNITFILFAFGSMTHASGLDTTAIEGPLLEITKVLLVIAGGACVAKVIHIGILYVMSSAADKSNAKMAIIPWIIGTLLCFGAATIGPAIINIFKIEGNVLDY